MFTTPVWPNVVTAIYGFSLSFSLLICYSILEGEHACVTGCNEFAGNEQCLPKALTAGLFVYHVYIKASKTNREHYCVDITCGCLLIV